MITEFAAAKINLALHVTGRRDDGYHLLDSAVMFAGQAGDVLEISRSDEMLLEIIGPFAEGLEIDQNNLVLKAHHMLQAEYPEKVSACAITLQKNLPVASGIGGGSADAAAALRAMVQLLELDIEPQKLADIALHLGADVPVCLSSTACRMRGIGEQIDDWASPPQLHAVLVNPLVGVSTAAIFKSLALQPGSTANEAIKGGFEKATEARQCLQWLAGCRNDLELAAKTIEPVVADVLTNIGDLPGCALARMSGSGATCFGLFENGSDAVNAVQTLKTTRPDWWVVASDLK